MIATGRQAIRGGSVCDRPGFIRVPGADRLYYISTIREGE